MARGNSLLTAYISIIPEFQGGVKAMGKDLADELKDAAKKSKIGDEIEDQVAEGFEKGAKGGGEEVAKTTEEGTSKGSGKGFAEGINGAKGLILGAIAALGIGTVVSDQISSALELGSSQAKITAQLALNPKEQEKVAAVAENLFKNSYGEDIGQVNDTLATIMGSIKGARKMSEEELAKMGRDVINLGTTYDLSAEEIARAGQTFINNGLGSFSEFTDLIAKSYANMGGAGAADFIDTITEYSGDLKTAGLDVEESFNLFNNAIKAGFYDTDKLADLVRETGIRVRAGDADETLKAFGFDPKTIKKAAMKGGDEWQKQWQAILAKLSKEGTAADLAAVVGTQSEDLFAQFKNVDWATITAGSEAVANDMERIDAALAEDPALAWETATRSFQGALQGVMLPLLEQALPLIEGFAKWIGENEQIVGRLALILGGTLAVGLGIATAASIAFMAPWLANPLTWIVLAIVAAVAALAAGIYLLISNWDAVSAAVGRFFGSVGTGIKTLAGNIAGFFKAIPGHIGNMISSMTEGVGRMASGVAKFFSGIGSGIKDTWNRAIQGGTEAVGWIQRKIGQFFTWVGSGISRVAQSFQAIGKGIGNFFVGIVNTVISALNFIIGGMNRIQFKAPDWVPNIGGRTVGINIPQIPTVPALATGADVMGPTLALIGEKDPETVINRGVANKVMDSQAEALKTLLSNGGGGGGVNVYLNVNNAQNLDEETLAEKLTEMISERVAWEQKR